jgi:hypothetical protein
MWVRRRQFTGRLATVTEPVGLPPIKIKSDRAGRLPPQHKLMRAYGGI